MTRVTPGEVTIELPFRDGHESVILLYRLVKGTLVERVVTRTVLSNRRGRSLKERVRKPIQGAGRSR